MHAARWFVCLVLCLAGTARAQVFQGQELVQAEAIANVSAVVPGEPFLVGLRLHMAPGWHSYWKYPGDAGIPTEIKWELPAGWTAGEIQWPVPLKLDEPGDIQIYGYRDDVLLLQQITPPKNIAGKNVTLPAKASWLVCEKICVPGDAAVQIALPVSTSNSAANTEMFARSQKQLPQAAPASLSAIWTREGKDLLLQVSGAELAKAKAIDFLPSPAESVAVGHPKLESHDGANALFRVSLPSATDATKSIPGVLVLGEGADRRAIEIAPQIASAKNGSSWHELLQFLLYGFVGGVILNLMPCVLPVISLKIFGFVQHAGASRARIFRSGLAFIAGIFAWFLGLALVLVFLKSAGHEITWAFQFTNPYFVLGMSAIVLVFALNLFGVFEITLPQWLNRGAVAGSSGEGDTGSFFQGVFATIFATPCTAPFLGVALGYSFTQSSSVIIAMFAAVALGMSAPYFLLSAQPAWLKFLPKPGPWMVRVKQLMGFLLLATLLFLLSVLGAQRGVSALIWASAFLLALSLACWIKGAFVTPLASWSRKLIGSAVIGLVVIGSAYYFVGEKFRSATPVVAASALEGGWERFTPDRLASELEAGHAVFVDFTAEWCITCKFNESTVLETSAVRDAFAQHKIVKLKADWTNGDPAITKLLKQFGRPGVPLYVLYPGASATPYVFPELLTKNIVLEKLETVNQQVAAQ
ncbi:MAG: thioredoxin family protein [Verrucomicrobiota bacterium]|nr:thioredoxin family protein [Verrucomicrobiota bacterium]